MFPTRLKTDSPLLFGLSALASVGMIILVLLAGYGVVAGENVDNGAVTLFFWLGVALLVSGIVGWFGVTRPDQHIDDINQPLDDGHGHGHDAHAADDHALPETTEKAIEPAHH